MYSLRSQILNLVKKRDKKQKPEDEEEEYRDKLFLILIEKCEHFDLSFSNVKEEVIRHIFKAINQQLLSFEDFAEKLNLTYGEINDIKRRAEATNACKLNLSELVYDTYAKKCKEPVKFATILRIFLSKEFFSVRNEIIDKLKEYTDNLPPVNNEHRQPEEVIDEEDPVNSDKLNNYELEKCIQFKNISSSTDACDSLSSERNICFSMMVDKHKDNKAECFNENGDAVRINEDYSDLSKSNKISILIVYPKDHKYYAHEIENCLSQYMNVSYCDICANDSINLQQSILSSLLNSDFYVPLISDKFFAEIDVKSNFEDCQSHKNQLIHSFSSNLLNEQKNLNYHIMPILLPGFSRRNIPLSYRLSGFNLPENYENVLKNPQEFYELLFHRKVIKTKNESNQKSII